MMSNLNSNVNNARHALSPRWKSAARRIREGAPDRGMFMRVRVQPRFWVFMITVTALVFAASLVVLQHRCAQADRQLRETRAYRDQLRAQTDTLADALDYAQTDAYVERVARDELGMIMPGEVRYVNGAQ